MCHVAFAPLFQGLGEYFQMLNPSGLSPAGDAIFRRWIQLVENVR
jgi:hypothetical protein